MIKKILRYIRNNFLLRNIVLALSFVLVFAYVTSLILNMCTRHGQKYSVPDFVGVTLERAAEMSKEAELQLVVIDSLYVPKQAPGTILDQSPKASMGVKSGRKIFLTINAFRPRTEIIPYVAGFSLRQAKGKLESKGFDIDQLVYRSDIATNNVLSQSWNGKPVNQGSLIKAELGSGITLVVGREDGAPMPVIPKVVGLTLREAKSRLWEIGFNIGDVKYDSGIKPEEYDKARIYKQTPGQEARNDYGSRVTVWLTVDGGKLTKQSRESDEKARLETTIEEVDETKMLEELGIE